MADWRAALFSSAAASSSLKASVTAPQRRYSQRRRKPRGVRAGTPDIEPGCEAPWR